MLNILAWQRIYLPFTQGASSVCLSSSPPPRIHWAVSHRTRLEAWKEIAASLVFISLEDKTIWMLNTSQMFHCPYCTWSGLVLEIEIFTQLRLTPNRLVHILAAVHQCISQSASDVLIASHRLKSKLELDKNFANRGASRNHFEMPASVSRRLHNFLDSATSPILRNKADV